MRYLRTPNQFQLRLGWLSVIAEIVGEQRWSRADLETLLVEIALAEGGVAQSHWLTEAGLDAPQGKMSPRAALDIVRMASVYGIYDSDTQALTDLGHVLRYTARWTAAKSPFRWQGSSKFIGTHILFATAGDIALQILRNLQEMGELKSADTPALLSICFEGLAARASVSEERRELIALGERSMDPSFHERVHRAFVHPHFEPLRELGYVSTMKKGGYVLTDAGNGLLAHARGSADDLLRRGLGRAVLAASGVTLCVPGSAEALRETLLHLPGPLSGAHAEASLETVVLLTQARLFEQAPGLWMDVEHAARLLRELERTTGGRIGLKSGGSSEDQNITWRERAFLEDATMWRTDSTARVTAERAIPTSNLTTPAVPSRRTPVAEIEAAPMADGLEAPPIPRRRAREIAIEPTPDVPPPEPPAVEPPAPPAVEPPVVSNAPLNPHALLWLSYVERLLAPPALGDVGGIRRGGPVSWIAAQRKLLDMPEDKLKGKRSPSDPTASQDRHRNEHGLPTTATSALRKWLERLDGTLEIRAFAECARLWAPDAGTPCHVNDLRGAFLWAGASSDRLTIALVEILREFVQRNGVTIRWDGWDMVREATRGLIDDTLHLGFWHAPELVARLGKLNDDRSADAALKLIEELTARTPGRKFDFTQEFAVPSELLDVLAELKPGDRIVQLDGATVEMSRTFGSPDGSAPTLRDEAGALLWPQETDSANVLSVVVDLEARTEEQAVARGAEYAAEAVSRLAFLGTLRTPLGTESDRTLIRRQGDGRLVDKDDKVYKPASEREIGMFFNRPEDLGIRQARPLDGNLVGVVRELPALAAIDRGVALDGRARLARSLHWLALADAPHLRPAERLSHGWVAFEHLFADGEQKGHLVAEIAGPVISLVFVRATAGRLYRDALAALHVSACRDPSIARLEQLAERWLGPDSWTLYATRGPGPIFPLPKPHEVDDDAGLRKLLGLRGELRPLAVAVEKFAPLIAWQLRSLAKMLENSADLAAWLEQRQRDATSFLMGVYEVRNQLVHDANPFGFDDAYRLRNLYDRYRVTINPVVVEVLRLVGADLAMPLKHAWALLRARFRELVAHRAGPKAKTPLPVESSALLACFP